jgi:hypothetical protein
MSALKIEFEFADGLNAEYTAEDHGRLGFGAPGGGPRRRWKSCRLTTRMSARTPYPE